MPEPVGRSINGVALIAGRYELIRELRSTHELLQWEAFDSSLERHVLLEFPRQGVTEQYFWQQARASARTNTATGERVLDAGTDPETGRVFVIREWPHQEVVHAVAELAAKPERAWPKPERTSPVRERTWPMWRFGLIGAALGLGLAVAVLRPGVDGWLAWVNAPLGKVSNQFVLGPVPTAAALAPTSVPTAGAIPQARSIAPTVAPTQRPTATPVAGVPRRVINTDGRGVALRASPGGARLPGKGYDEGATVTALESSGEWTHIRGADGREGWVLSVTLGPV